MKFRGLLDSLGGKPMAGFGGNIFEIEEWTALQIERIACAPVTIRAQSADIMLELPVDEGTAVIIGQPGAGVHRIKDGRLFLLRKQTAMTD